MESCRACGEKTKNLIACCTPGLTIAVVVNSLESNAVDMQRTWPKKTAQRAEQGRLFGREGMREKK
jgi:hypothetical protein